MTSRFEFKGRNEFEILLRFGGGLHTRASEDEIDEREAKDGQNVQLDLDNRELRNREPYDFLGTVPNAGEIRGFATLRQADGSVFFLVQGSDRVYDWDGSSFTEMASVNASARLRGRKEANWVLEDKVLITDLNLSQPVMEFDGVTLANTSFNLPGSFLAKYCHIAAERAHFANVESNGVATPQLVAGSQRGDYTILSVTDRPSSSLNVQDPWFLLTPDLKPINGMVQAFTSTDNTGTGQDQRLVLSSESGVLSKINGSDATNFAIAEFYPESAANGDESLRFIGNDIVYGRQGRIESVAATERFGDVAEVDISVPIKDQIETFTDWTTVYNSRNQRVYFFPSGVSELYVLYKELLATDLSPWFKWTTQHSLAFQPTAVMNMFDPDDGLEYTFMGDSSGNIYRLEGTGLSGDAGSANIEMEWLTGLARVNRQAQVYRVSGVLWYRANLSNTVKLRFEYAGEAVFNEEVEVVLPAVDTAAGADHWGATGAEASYWGGDFYWNVPFAGRLTRQEFGPAGQSNAFQVRVIVDGVNKIEINSIGLNFEAAS